MSKPLMQNGKAFAMMGIGKTAWITKDRPKCGSRDAIVRPLVLAPCTSDIHTCYTGAIGDRTNHVLGHEAVCVVDEVGFDVKDFKRGDRVIVPAITPEWDTEAVQDGVPAQHCTGLLTGWKFSNSKDGVFAELIHVNNADQNLARIPPGLSLEAAVMLPDMVTTGFHGAELADIQFGDDVVVLGIGPVGLMCVAGAKLRGAGRIFGVGTRKRCVDLAKEYGATDIVSYKNGSTVEQILKATDGKGVDCVIIAGGPPSTMADAVKMCKPGGNISCVNYFDVGENLPVPRIEWGCGMAHKTIRGGLCPGGRVRMERLAKLIVNGRLDPSKLVSHKFTGLENVEKAVALMKEKTDDVVKPIVFVQQPEFD